MGSGIFLIENGQLVQMRDEPYDLEAILQDLLARYPDLLPGDQIDRTNPRRWLLVGREVLLRTEEAGPLRWSVDHVFLDQDGVPTLVEVKRSVDYRIRREVVGQMLDYAANTVAPWRAEVRRMFELDCAKTGLNPEEVLRRSLGDELDSEIFWRSVETNLSARKLRLIFVADAIPVELQGVVEFLNENMQSIEVLAVEIKRYTSTSGAEGFVSRVLGQTAAAQEKKRQGNQWDEASFLITLRDRKGEESAAVARRVCDWARTELPRFSFGSGVTDGSVFPVLDVGDASFYPFALWTYGSIEVQFQYMRDRPPFDQEAVRVEAIRRLNEVPGIDIPLDAHSRRPSFGMAALIDPPSLERFFEVVSWMIEQFKRSQGSAA